MTYLESILKVLAIGLVLGAGLPALFGVGLVAFSNGEGGTHEDGTTVAPNPALKYVGLLLFVVVSAVILIAILWITKSTIEHHFGINPVAFIPGS